MPPTEPEVAALGRLGLAAPTNLEQRALRALVLGAVRRHSLVIDPDID